MSLESTFPWKLSLVALLLATCLILACLIAPMRAAILVGAVIGFVVFCMIALRHPEVFLVACVFMPQWKTAWPLSLVDRSVDLTLVMLGGLLIGTAWRLLKHVSGLDRRSVADLFRGQWLVISSYCLFCFVVALSYMYTTAPHYGETKLLRFLLIGTLFLVSGLVLINQEIDFRRFSFLFVGCGFVTAIQMVLHLKQRAVGAEGDITRIGAGWLMGMSLLLLVCYPFFEKAKHNSILMAIGLPFLSGGLIASAARGPIVSVALILPLTYFWFSGRRLVAGRAFLAGLLLLSCVGSYAYLRHADPDKYSSKISELLELSKGDSASGSGAKRINFYRTTLAAIPDHFWFGNGVGSWSVFYYGKDAREYPHNLFLETTFEEGIVGQLSLFLFLTLVIVSSYLNLTRGNRQFGVLIGLLLYSLLISMFSGDLDDNRLLWFWTGVTLAACRNTSLWWRMTSPLGLRRFSPENEASLFELRPPRLSA